jgi:hypothetical protein
VVRSGAAELAVRGDVAREEDVANLVAEHEGLSSARGRCSRA